MFSLAGWGMQHVGRQESKLGARVSCWADGQLGMALGLDRTLFGLLGGWLVRSGLELG